MSEIERHAGTKPEAGATKPEAGATVPKSGDAAAEADATDDRSRAATYAAVLAVEAVVIAALWFFGRYFSA